MENNSNIKKDRAGDKIKQIYEWLDTVVVAVLLVVFLFTFVFRVVGIEGNSMNNTLFDKDRVVISNFFYEPKAGDIVVISRNYNNDLDDTARSASPIIKRVIATAGQTVDIDFERGIVYVDGEPLDEPYIKELTHKSGSVTFPVTVPEKSVFVMGDNRNDSLDSRYIEIGDHGMVDTRYILGKAILRILPITSFGGLYG